MPTLWEERHTAMHLLRAGHPVSEVAHQLERTPQWVRKWRKRFEEQGWQGLADCSRAPHTHGTRFSDTVRCAIAQARSELEAEAAWGTGLKYVGGPAVRTRLKAQPGQARPSVATIERVLREKEMTRPYQAEARPAVQYSHLHPSEPHQLCQVDIVPHVLTGGEAVACFNAIDVVSRYPSGQAYAQQRSQDAANFLLHVWQTLGIAQYTQLDNEGCFSGGFTHPYVLGKVVRLALTVGTELVFSPVRHPKSNGSVERFHQDYNRHVWEDTYLDSRHTVDQQADHFFQLYRHSRHHTALDAQTPHEVHHRLPPRRLGPAFRLPEHKLPLREGRVHFMRAVRLASRGTISVLNADWPVPDTLPHTGVWATLELRGTGATLSVYDAAPDHPQRICLASYPFPLSETVQPYQPVDSTFISPQPDESKPSSQDQPAGQPISAPTLRFRWTYTMLNRVESLPFGSTRAHGLFARELLSETIY